MQWFVLLISTAYSKCDTFRQWNSTHVNWKASVFKPRPKKFSQKKVFPTGIRTSFRLGFRHWLFWWNKVNIYFFLFFRNIDCNLYCFLCYCLNKLFSDKKHVTSWKEFIREKNSFAPRGGFGFVLSGVTTELWNKSRSGKYRFSIRTFLFKSDESKSSVENHFSIVVYSLLSVL